MGDVVNSTNEGERSARGDEELPEITKKDEQQDTISPDTRWRTLKKFNEHPFWLLIAALIGIMAGGVEVYQCASPAITERLNPCTAYFTKGGGEHPRDLAGIPIEEYGDDDPTTEYVRWYDAKSPSLDGDRKNRYWFDGSFTAEAILRNNTDKDLLVTESRVVLSDVRRDDVPYLMVKNGRDRYYYYGYSVISLEVANVGFSDIKDLKLHVTLREKASDAHRPGKEISLAKDVGYLAATNSLQVDIDPSEFGGLADGVKMEVFVDGAMDVDRDVSIIENDVDLVVVQSDGNFRVYEPLRVPKTGFDITVAGVFLETGIPSQTYELSISVPIGAGEQKSLPLLFFPDLSCSCLARVEFDVEGLDGGDAITVMSADEPFHFDISKSTVQRAFRSQEYDNVTFAEAMGEQKRDTSKQ